MDITNNSLFPLMMAFCKSIPKPIHSVVFVQILIYRHWLDSSPSFRPVILWWRTLQIYHYLQALLPHYFKRTRIYFLWGNFSLSLLKSHASSIHNLIGSFTLSASASVPPHAPFYPHSPISVGDYSSSCGQHGWCKFQIWRRDFRWVHRSLSHIMSCGFVFYVRCLKIFYLPNFYLHIVFFIYWHSFLPVGLRDLVFFQSSFSGEKSILPHLYLGEVFLISFLILNFSLFISLSSFIIVCTRLEDTIKINFIFSYVRVGSQCQNSMWLIFSCPDFICEKIIDCLSFVLNSFSPFYW